MKKLITDNFGMKLLSVFIAILIWLLVANTNDPVITKRFSGIPVKVINETVLTKEGYSYEILDGEKVYVSVKGKESILGSMTEDDFNAYADFSKLSVVDAVPIDVEAKRYQDQLEITLGTTNTMKIKKDELVEINVPINIVTEGEVGEGYAIGKLSGTPNLVKVRGPKNVLKNAKEIRANIALNGITADITTTAKPVLLDEGGEIIDNAQLEFDTATINILVELWKTKKIDINVDYRGEVADGYTLSSFDYEPKQLIIAAPSDELKDIGTIDLPDISIEGIKDKYEQDIEITQELLPGHAIPADSTNTVQVTAVAEKVISRTFTILQDDLSVKNKESLKFTYADPAEYKVTVQGAQSEINALRIEDLDPWIELQELSAGSHNMNLHLKEIKGIEVLEKDDITIVVQ